MEWSCRRRLRKSRHHSRTLLLVCSPRIPAARGPRGTEASFPQGRTGQDASEGRPSRDSCKAPHRRHHLGLATRAPRPLLPVANRPLISYALSWLGQGGVCDVVLCTNRETGALQTRLAQYVPEEMRPQYHEDRVPQGSAGCLREAACGSDAETFVVVAGTTIPSVELGELLRSHQASGAAVTVVVHNETPRNEKPGRWVPNGIYIFERRTLTR